MAYRRLSLDERIKIFNLLREGYAQKDIACQLQRSKSTISEEIHRLKPYCPYQAHEDCKRKSLLRRRRTKLQDDTLRTIVLEKLKSRWSPEQICGRLKKIGASSLCHETIYRFIYASQEQRTELIACLRQKRSRRRRKNLRKNRNPIRDALSIHDRPKEALDRQTLGHWEGDLIVGIQHKSAIPTLVERSSRLVVVTTLSEGAKSSGVCLDVSAALGSLPKIAIKSLTWDRGLEMAGHKRLSDLLGMPVYFADPYSSWQRGTNENTNGLIRDYFPKSTDFRNVSIESLLKVSEALNDRPRKTLNYWTPRETFDWLLGHPGERLNSFLEGCEKVLSKVC